MPKYRVVITQTLLYDFEVEAPNANEADALAERVYAREAGPGYSLPDADSIDHEGGPVCRDCGEALDIDEEDVTEGRALPGYCGPCSIPEQQDRESGRSEETDAEFNGGRDWLDATEEAR